MRDASTVQVCRQPPRLIALPLPHAPALTPAMKCCGATQNTSVPAVQLNLRRPPAPSIVLPQQLTISRVARRWLPRRRLLWRQLRLPRVRPGALPALVRHLSSTAAARGAYPIQKITEIFNKITEMYKKVTELEISSWNVLSLLRSEVAYIRTEPILP
jgi:hypothetical protein